MTSLHLQHFIVQMSLANLEIFGQSCIFSKQEILFPSPSLIRLLRSTRITQPLFLRQTWLPLLIKQPLGPGLGAELVLNSQFRNSPSAWVRFLGHGSMGTGEKCKYLSPKSSHAPRRPGTPELWARCKAGR